MLGGGGGYRLRGINTTLLFFFFFFYCLTFLIENLEEIQVLDHTRCMTTCVPTEPTGHKHKIVQFLAKIVVTVIV